MTKITEKNPLAVERQRLQQVEHALASERQSLTELERDLKAAEAQRIELIRAADSKSLEQAGQVHVSIKGLMSAVSIKQDTINILEAEVQTRLGRIEELERTEESEALPVVYEQFMRELQTERQTLSACLSKTYGRLRTLEEGLGAYQQRYRKLHGSERGELSSQREYDRIRALVVHGLGVLKE